MLEKVRVGGRIAFNRPSIFGLVYATVLLEVIYRIGMGHIHPVLSVVAPPVFAVPILGAAAPTVRTAVTDPSKTPDWQFRESLRETGARLLVLAIVGQGLALALGTALFLVVHTPIQYALYALDHAVLQQPRTGIFAGPLFGVAVGAFVVWGLFVPGVVHTIRGESSGVVTKSVVSTAITQPRRTLATMAIHGGVATLSGMAVLAIIVSDLTSFSPLYSWPLTKFLLISGGIGGLICLVSATFLYPFHVAWAPVSTDSWEVPVRRVFVVAIVVVALVGGVSLVRVTDARPLPDAEPLPDEPNAAYEQALDNTAVVPHNVTVRHNGGAFVHTRVRDHGDRRYKYFIRVSTDSYWTKTYASSGGIYGTTSQWENESSPRGLDLHPGPFALGRNNVSMWSGEALPYYRIAVEPNYRLHYPAGLPHPESEGWTLVDRNGDTLVLEMTNESAVFESLYAEREPGDPATWYHTPRDGQDILRNGSLTGATVHTARIRMRIDTDRGVITDGRAHVNVSLSNSRFTDRKRYVVRTGDDVTVRPDAIGSPTVGEWIWKLFRY